MSIWETVIWSALAPVLLLIMGITCWLSHSICQNLACSKLKIWRHPESNVIVPHQVYQTDIHIVQTTSNQHLIGIKFLGWWSSWYPERLILQGAAAVHPNHPSPPAHGRPIATINTGLVKMFKKIILLKRLPPPKCTFLCMRSWTQVANSRVEV